MKYPLIICIAAFLFASCSELDELETKSFDINGFWINQQMVNDSVYTFERSADLEDNGYCFGFKSRGKFIERKNAGWCGTPPISYADYEGSWNLHDSIIEINTEYWGGTADYKWKIVSLDEGQLSIIWLEQEYEHSN